MVGQPDGTDNDYNDDAKDKITNFNFLITQHLLHEPLLFNRPSLDLKWYTIIEHVVVAMQYMSERHMGNVQSLSNRKTAISSSLPELS